MKIILADDHALVRKGLRDCLETIDPECRIEECASREEVEQALAREPAFDLAILDLYMPGMNRAGGVAALRARYPDLPILIVSGSVDHEDMASVLKEGAAGFLPKSFGLEAIQRAVQLILAGERFFPTTLLEELNAGPKKNFPLFPGLTKREQEAWNLLKDGLSNKEIAQRMKISEATVKLHTRGLFRKLGVPNRTLAMKKYMELLQTRLTPTNES